MEENYNANQAVEGENKKQDCGCDDGCCQPKKKNTWSKWLFALILLAAVAIIGIKLAGHSGASAKQSVVPGKAACCDTSKAGSKTCDTTKSSSCCSKK